MNRNIPSFTISSEHESDGVPQGRTSGGDLKTLAAFQTNKNKLISFIGRRITTRQSAAVSTQTVLREHIHTLVVKASVVQGTSLPPELQ